MSFLASGQQLETQLGMLLYHNTVQSHFINFHFIAFVIVSLPQTTVRIQILEK